MRYLLAALTASVLLPGVALGSPFGAGEHPAGPYDGYLHAAETTTAVETYKNVWWGDAAAVYHPCRRFAARVMNCKVTVHDVLEVDGQAATSKFFDYITVAEHRHVVRVTSSSAGYKLDIGRRSWHRWEAPTPGIIRGTAASRPRASGSSR